MEKLITNLNPDIAEILAAWLEPSTEITPSRSETHVASLENIQEYLTGIFVDLSYNEVEKMNNIKSMLVGIMYIKSDLKHFIIKEGED